jgi:flagellar biosynthetic protein FlhB
MMQAVPKADVIITNPTHFAVALKYDSIKMNAPKVTAKGAGKIAERIKSLAREHGVPVVENKELARNLHKLVEIGQDIPAALYQSVAEVLAYIYKLKRNW